MEPTDAEGRTAGADRGGDEMTILLLNDVPISVYAKQEDAEYTLAILRRLSDGRPVFNWRVTHVAEEAEATKIARGWGLK